MSPRGKTFQPTSRGSGVYCPTSGTLKPLEGDMRKRPVIDLDCDLPMRARALTSDTVSNVFGGCNSAFSCRPHTPNACCPGYECGMHQNGASITYRCSMSAAL